MTRSVRNVVCWSVGAIAIGSAAPMSWAQPANPIVQLAEKMAQPIDFPGTGHDVALREVLAMLSKQTGVTFDINARAFSEPEPAAGAALGGDRGAGELVFVAAQERSVPGTTPGVKAKPGAANKGAAPGPPAGGGSANVAEALVMLPKMTGVRLTTILTRLLRKIPMPADYVLRRDGVEITTARAKIAEFYRGSDHPSEPDVGPEPAGPDDRFRYLPLVQVEFHKTPLEEALRALADATDYNILLDPRAAEKAKPATATLINLPLDTAVELLANMSGLKVVMRDRALYVTTKENSDAMRKELRDRSPLPGPTGPIPGPGIGPMGPGGNPSLPRFVGLVHGR